MYRQVKHNVQHVPDQHPQLLPGGDSGGPGPGQYRQWSSARRHSSDRPQAAVRLPLGAGASYRGEVWLHRETEPQDSLDQPRQQSGHCQHTGRYPE